MHSLEARQLNDGLFLRMQSSNRLIRNLTISLVLVNYFTLFRFPTLLRTLCSAETKRLNYRITEPHTRK